MGFEEEGVSHVTVEEEDTEIHNTNQHSRSAFYSFALIESI